MNLKTVLLSTLGIVILSGCSTHMEVKINKVEKKCFVEKTKAPTWICEDHKDYYTIAHAKENKLGFVFTRNAAINQGNEILSKTIAKDLKNKIKNVMLKSKIKSVELRELFSTNISKQIVNININSTEKSKLWKSPKGSVYILMKLNKDKIYQSSIRNVKSLIRYENSLNKIFLKNNGIKNLEQEFN